MINQTDNKVSQTFQTKQEHKDLVLEVILRTLEALDTPVSLGLSLRLRAGSIEDFPNITPHDYLDRATARAFSRTIPRRSPFDYKTDIQALACVKKLSQRYVKGTTDLAAKAVIDFKSLEETVELTNRKFRSLSFSFRDRSILERARLIVLQALGYSWKDRFSFSLKFGPGTTLSFTGRRPAHIVAKIGNENRNTITPRAVRYFHHALCSDSELYRWGCANGIVHPITLRFNRNAFTEVNYDRFSTVPKDFSKLRPIGVGADINILLQLNAGDWIRTCHDRYFKTEMRQLPNEHKLLVEADSSVGAYATIDLSNASSTIAYELVKFILPTEWFELLDALRAPNTLMPDGTLHENAMFSAMGCGFTFELETLIFRSICQATLDFHGDIGFVSSFGDDMIVPSHCYDAVVSSLVAAGFSINLDKSFSATYPSFKESCGSDWFDGVNVRPIYLKEFSNDISGIYSLCNRIAAIAFVEFCGPTLSRCSSTNGFTFDDIAIDQAGCVLILDKRFIKPFRLALAPIPLSMRHGGPPYMGDCVIHGLKPLTRTQKYQTQIRVLTQKTQKVSYERLGHPELQLIYLRLGLPSFGVTPRDEPYKLKSDWAPLLGSTSVEWY